MAYSTTDILTWAAAAQPLSAYGESKRQYTQGGTVDLDLHKKIYIERKSLAWQLAQDPTDADGLLFEQGNYVYALLFPYLFAAQQATGGGGQVVNPTTPTVNVFPFYITSSDFESDGVSYNNPDIIGQNLELFVDEYAQQFYTAGILTFSMTATGLIINLPGFDANTNTYNIRIGKLGNT